MRASRLLLGVIGAAVLIAVSGGVYAQSLVGAGSGGHWGNVSGPTYNVTFHETGLPAGTVWSVALSGHFGGWGHHFRHHGLTSNNSSIVIALPNGTYTYRVHPVAGFELLAGGNGTFVVNGSSPATLNVAFGKPVTYTVTFTESGLTAGTNWTVRVSPVGGGFGGWFGRYHNRHLVQTTSNTSMTFGLPNGTYRYHVSPIYGYRIADNGSHGTFNVSGASPATISVVFTKLVTYTVTFSETGLPAGTNWTAAVFSWSSWTGGLHFVRADTTSISFQLTNGTYFFHVRAHGYVATNNSSGILNVTGASPPTVDVTFAPYSSVWTPAAPSVGGAAKA